MPGAAKGWSLVGAVLLNALAASAGAQTVVPPLSQTDSLLLTIAADVVRGRTDANQEWFKPWFGGEFLLLPPAGGALAVFAGPLPNGLGPALSEHALGGTHRGYFVPPGSQVPTRFDLRRYDGRQLVAWPLEDSIYSIADSVLANVFAVYHEAFHVYQLDNGWFRNVPPTAVGRVPLELVVAPEFQELAAREREMLGRALYLTNPDSTKALLRDYLEIRAQRTALLPPQFRDIEAYDERHEASAQLVAFRAALLAVEGTTNDMVPLIGSDLRNTPPFDAPYGPFGPFRQWHIYATGSAIGVLLERMGVSWKRELEQGATFLDLLTRAVAR
jgi:hypothetical protein